MSVFPILVGVGFLPVSFCGAHVASRRPALLFPWLSAHFANVRPKALTTRQFLWVAGPASVAIATTTSIALAGHMAFLACCLVVIASFDLAYGLIPPTVIGLVLTGALYSSIASISPLSAISALAGAAFFVAPWILRRLMIALYGPRGALSVGLGEMSLAAALGAYLGAAPVAIGFAIAMTGGCVAGLGVRRRQQPRPFAPAFCNATLAAALALPAPLSGFGLLS